MKCLIGCEAYDKEVTPKGKSDKWSFSSGSWYKVSLGGSYNSWVIGLHSYSATWLPQLNGKKTPTPISVVQYNVASGIIEHSITRKGLCGFDIFLKSVPHFWSHCDFCPVFPITCFLLLLMLFLGLNPEPRECQGKCSTTKLHTRLHLVTYIQMITVTAVVSMSSATCSLEDVKYCSSAPNYRLRTCF